PGSAPDLHWGGCGYRKYGRCALVRWLSSFRRLAVCRLEHRGADFRIDAYDQVHEIKRAEVGHAVVGNDAALGQEMPAHQPARCSDGQAVAMDGVLSAVGQADRGAGAN